MKFVVIIFLILTSCYDYNYKGTTKKSCISAKKQIKSTTCLSYKSGIKCRATIDDGNITIYDLIIPGDLVCYCNITAHYESNNKKYYDNNSWKLSSDCVNVE